MHYKAQITIRENEIWVNGIRIGPVIYEDMIYRVERLVKAAQDVINHGTLGQDEVTVPGYEMNMLIVATNAVMAVIDFEDEEAQD